MVKTKLSLDFKKQTINEMLRDHDKSATKPTLFIIFINLSIKTALTLLFEDY